MENQHRQITGYNELGWTDIDRMNVFKAHEATLMELLDEALAMGADSRWVAIARTDLQKAFMCATRAIARPQGYDGKA